MMTTLRRTQYQAFPRAGDHRQFCPGLGSFPRYRTFSTKLGESQTNQDNLVTLKGSQDQSLSNRNVYIKEERRQDLVGSTCL